MADALPWRGATFRLGVIVALITAAADQAVKLWLLYGFDLPGRGRVALTPFLDLVLAWNTGISYGLFQQAGPLGQWALFALKVVAVVLLALWLARTGSRLSGVALGLIIGGAIGNLIDRIAYGAVTDFIKLPLGWPPFNLADTSITLGVLLLLLVIEAPRRDSLVRSRDERQGVNGPTSASR